MVIRRAEIPALNIVITRSIPYQLGQDRFGGIRMGNLERTARARRLEIDAGTKINTQNSTYQNLPIRRYLVRPDRETFDYIYNAGGAFEEARSLILEWEVGNAFTDLGKSWRVTGVGFYDSAGRMLELLAVGFTPPGG